MSSDGAFPVPPSFVALYVPRGKTKPVASGHDIGLRHEFCDDLAHMMTDQAKLVHWDMGLDEATVLARMLEALQSAPEPVVSGLEAQWVVCRLAELLNWPMPPLPSA
jgi:hypothetical protein